MNDCLVLGAPTIGSVGGAALELQGGDLRLLGYTTIAGGASLGVDGPCIEGTGTLRAEPSVSLDCPAPQTPATVPSTLAAMPRVTTDQPSPGAVTAALHGPVGHLGILGVGLPGPVVAIPGVRDPAFWLTPTAITQAIGVPMTSLPLASTTTIPNNPVFLGTVLVWHGFTYDASTGLQASNPSLHVVD